jgi:6,7-dimethyl-8-ribityllumazine synthase
VSGNLNTGATGDRHASGLRVALVCSRFNDEVVSRLEAGARSTLEGADAAEVTTIWVPGAWEIPIAAAQLARSGSFDAIVGIGCIIRGETYHFETIADQSAAGLMQVSLATGVVVTNGIITTENEAQAWDRADGAVGNKGSEAAVAAIELVNALRRYPAAHA